MCAYSRNCATGCSYLSMMMLYVLPDLHKDLDFLKCIHYVGHYIRNFLDGDGELDEGDQTSSYKYWGCNAQCDQ